MGCYMSTPDDKVYITEGRGKNFRYATASCQGWRREQEDAEDCIPYFDEDASLFVLCDGHGGAEVAKYTVEHLPDFIKNHPLYKEGKYEEALEKAFIDFDALLRTDAVIAELNKMAFDDEQSKKQEDKMDAKEESDSSEPALSNEPSGSAGGSSSAGPSSAGPSSSSNNGSNAIVDDVDTETLRREAQVPLDELIDRYSGQPPIKGRAHSIRQASLNLAASPVIRSSQGDEEDGDDDTGVKKDSNQNDKAPEPSSSKQVEEGPSSSTGQRPRAPDFREILKKAMEKYFDEDDENENSDDDSEFNGNEDFDSNEEDDEEDDDDEDEDGDDERDEETTGETSKSKRLRKRHRRSASNRADSSSEDDEDDSEDEDEQEDDEEVDEDEEEEDVDDDDDNDDDDDDDGELDGRFACLKKLNQNLKAASRVHKPGMDSGCTVVVALIKNNKLYVASAGDSRCIMIMRNGQCKPMSFDHKPEDTIEHRRIQKAGGRVTEGRVNGGLNLSRALGDFTYKDTYLDAKDQMITPCPDVRTADLDPEQVEYILLACDGIWNSMKNQQATKFIRKVAPNVGYDLVEICLGLFRNCIAPGTDGDGTGCDNMTCIIVRFESSNEKESSTNKYDLNTSTTKNRLEGSADSSTTTVTNKRSADEDSDSKPTSKRRCMRLLEIE